MYKLPNINSFLSYGFEINKPYYSNVKDFTQFSYGLMRKTQIEIDQSIKNKWYTTIEIIGNYICRYLYFRKYNVDKLNNLKVELLTKEHYKKYESKDSYAIIKKIGDKRYLIRLYMMDDYDLELNVYHEVEHLYQFSKQNIDKFHSLEYKLRPSEITSHYYPYFFYHYYHYKLGKEQKVYDLKPNLVKEIRKLSNKVCREQEKNIRYFWLLDRKLNNKYLDFSLQCILAVLRFYRKIKN